MMDNILCGINKFNIMKKGFWTGCLAFFLAKITHLIVTYVIGYVLAITIGNKPILWDIINIIDNPLVGIIFLILVTTFIYKKLTKSRKINPLQPK